jgi:hypothetical protein
MKKLLIALLALVCMCTLAVPVMAKTSKPPKNICFKIGNDPRSFCMVTKKSATLRVGDEKLPLYTIQGFVGIGTPWPADGTGYMLDDLFVFHLSTSINTNIDITGLWNVEMQVGEAFLNEVDATGFTSTQDTLSVIAGP